MKVDIYRNLNTRELGKTWSILDRTTRRVIGRVLDTGMLVDDVSFIVQPGGHKRVNAEGRKNVHAFVRGSLDVTGIQEVPTPDNLVEITYNPYEHNYFYRVDTNEAVYETDQVYIDKTGVFMIKD